LYLELNKGCEQASAIGITACNHPKNRENELTLASVVKEIATCWRSSSPKINKRASERASEQKG